MNRNVHIGTVLAVSLWVGGCAGPGRIGLARHTGGSAALFGQFQAYDGHTGRPISFRALIDRCAAADVVLFGEEHSDTVCNQLEAQVLYALAARERPLALAMEFFESDTQAALDAYLRGRIEETPFRQQARQRNAYVHSHRPLIELCRQARIPVLAANAPRRLVQAYRRSGLTFAEFRAGLDPADQRWLPASSDYLGGPYATRFRERMRAHQGAMPSKATATAPAANQPTSQATTGPATPPPAAPQMPPVSQPVASRPAGSDVAAFYRAQLLWDDALATSLADFRQQFGPYRVLLVVGVFHVAHDGGTAVKLRQRRPRDRIITVAYASTADGEFPIRQCDRHAADILVYGIAPPPVEAKEAPSAPTSAMSGAVPVTAPASAPRGGPSD